MATTKKTHWTWKVYFLIYLLIVLVNTIEFFKPLSSMNLYYQYLIAYHTLFIVPYLLNAFSIILNAFALIPFCFFILKNNSLSAQFCRWLFIFRLSLDLAGRSYELQTLKALFHGEARIELGGYVIPIAVLVIATLIIFSAPSYVALYLYGFRRGTPSVKALPQTNA